MHAKKISLFICVVIALLLVVGCLLLYVNNAPFRWSRNLCDAIRLGETDKALQLIDTGIEKGYSLDTLSEHPSFIWSLLEATPLTPLQAACKNGNYSVAEKLLKEGTGVRPVD